MVFAAFKVARRNGRSDLVATEHCRVLVLAALSGWATVPAEVSVGRA
jgi:hypothetical protein